MPRPKGKKTNRRPVTVNEALRVVALSEVRVSPDGMLAAFVKSVVRTAENRNFARRSGL